MTVAETSQRRFEVLRLIATGGFGSVFLCRLTLDEGFTRVVAVKLLHHQWSENDEVASRMRDEARLLGLLSHRNIVDVFDLTRLDGRVAVVMEYLDAVDLKTVLACGVTLPVRAALQFLSQVTSALDTAWNQAPMDGEAPLHVVHRDIKPSNLMLDADGVVKVLDFGVARGDFAGREAQTMGMAFGSFEYMPPERRFMESGGETSDVYSVAAVLFEALCGGEKLGKGKLKVKSHVGFVQGRLDALRERLQGPPELVDELLQFMGTMLSFIAEDRPTPAQVTSTFKRLARGFPAPGLEEWAEDELPDLLRARRETQDEGAQDPLIGKVLSEHRLAIQKAQSRTLSPVPPIPASIKNPMSASTPATPVSAVSPLPPPPTKVTVSPGAAAPAHRTKWIPKRVRDAAPSRPPITGTQTPAPLRAERREGPATPPPPPSEPLADSKDGRSGLASFLLGVFWVASLMVLLFGTAALVAALYMTAS
ncbi:MAG: protein kinase [Myxococcota bacterium]